MRAIHLTLAGAIALAACDTDSIAPEQEATLAAQESGVLAEPGTRRSRMFDRLLERAKELGDPEAEALVAELKSAHDAARAAMEAGDREAARELMTAAREAMQTLRTTLRPGASDSFPQRGRRFDRISREDRDARFQGLVDRIRAEGGAEAQALLDQALEAQNHLRAAREAEDREAIRTHAQALRNAMRGAIELTFPEQLEQMRGRRGRMRHQE